MSRTALLGGYLSAVPPLSRALGTDTVYIDGATLRIPGSWKIRASVIAGNVRMRAILDACVIAGDTVVDVGANIGAVAVHAARRVGPTGRVFAFEPAADNLAVLRHNVAANGCGQVVVLTAAAGRRRETRQFFLRGDVSAVNSLFPDSMYAQVSEVTEIEVLPLDEVVDGNVRLVKIDVEGAELEVLEGMPRILAQPQVVVVAEWHPVLQRAAGFEADELPLRLLDRGFRLEAVDHVSSRPLARHGVEALMTTLMRARRPVELVAHRGAVSL